MTITARTTLGVTRSIVGVLSLTAPQLAAWVFGVPADPSAAWITRLFGSRELVLAATLLAAPPDQVASVAALGAGIDGVDVVSSAVELARGRISTYTFVSGGCGAVVFTLLGLAAMRAAQQ
jgi:hypothetical protein